MARASRLFYWSVCVVLVFPASGSLVVLNSTEGEDFLFPVEFLRENLKGAIDEKSLQRVAKMPPANLSLVSASAKPDGSWLLTFSDGVVGDFMLPPAAAEASRDKISPSRELEQLSPSLWGALGDTVARMERLLAVPGREGGLRFPFSALGLGAGKQQTPSLSAEALQLRSALFEGLQRYGLALVEGGPPEIGLASGLADKLVGSVETTIFGYSFDVRAVENASNLAYANVPLQPHTDLPYMLKPPDVQLFGCLQAADEGGASLLMDSFAAAEALRQQDPEAFQLLASTEVLFMDITEGWDVQASHPILEIESGSGKLKQVYFNERARDSWRHWRPGAALPTATRPDFYRALRAFVAFVEREELQAEIMLRPGDVLLMDNRRVMHSRHGFTGERHMEGCYLNWQSLMGTWSSLQRQIKEEPLAYCGNVVI